MDDPGTLLAPLSSAPPDRREARDRLIVALDFPGGVSALSFVERLDGAVLWFKVGLELYIAAGPAIVDRLRDLGYRVFLDLKLHDIPNTVAGAVRSAAALGAELLTVHAAGGPAMLAAAAEAVAGCPNAPKLLAVTVLTSMDQPQLAAIGIDREPAHQVSRLARMASANGIRGFVCSPEEAGTLRKCLPESTLVTPGIRPAGFSAGDQKRTASPASALLAGADYLVVGRPITQAADPALAANQVLAEMSASRL